MEEESQKNYFETSTIEHLEQVSELLQNGNIDRAKEFISEMIDATKEYKHQVEHGRVRNGGYADLVMRHLRAFISPAIIRSEEEIQNGTCFFVELKDKSIAVTNHHVIQHWLDLKKKGIQAEFRIGNVIYPSDLEPFIIDSCQQLDLATILVPPDIKLAMEDIGTLFYKYEPPLTVNKGDLVFALGWPGVLREDQIKQSNIYVVTILDEVIETTDRRFIIQFHRDDWTKRFGKKEIVDLTSLGGLSGGPVFLFSDGDLRLVGVIFENMEGFIDGVQCVHFKYIKPDGYIDKP